MAYDTVEFLPSENRKMSLENLTNGSSIDESSANIEFSNLYPAVIECFAIILCGYIAGRAGLISHTESKGLNVFVGTFSLPSLIFLSMAKLDFSSVNWVFLSSICLSKTLVFVFVAFITLLVYRPIDFGKAGIYAIFSTQSNDFALGYPIVAALYGKDHPDFASYLYLAAPISLAFLNPIGFILMEIGRRRRDRQAPESLSNSSSASRRKTCGLVFDIIKDFVLNPFVFMTVLGLCANLALNHQLPTVLEGFLKIVFGQAFSASALFLLGLTMVGKIQSLRGAALVTPGILVAVKTVLLPLVLREVVSMLKPVADNTSTADFSNYGFLYGTIPTAPGMLVFATKYNVAVDMVWVLIVFSLTRKWRKVPHFITFCLTLSQAISCIGALLWNVIDHSHRWKLYLQFVVFSFGVFSSRFWTAILAVSLFLLRWRSLGFVLGLRPYLALIGWGIPGVLVCILVMLVKEDQTLVNDPNFQYGSTQAIVALLLLWFSLFSTVVCLILHQRYEKRFNRYESLLTSEDEPQENLPPYQDTPDTSPSSTRSFLPKATSNGGRFGNSVDPESPTLSLESLSSPDADEHDRLFSYSDRLNSSTSLNNNNNNNRNKFNHKKERTQTRSEPEELVILRDKEDEYQIMRHVVLLLLLCGSMIVGFALCMWTLVSPDINGIYVELIFLDILLNFGQGAFTAVIFGLDAKLIFVPILKCWRRVIYGAPTIQLPSRERLSLKTKQTCEQFTNYHMDKCIQEIVKDKRCRLKQLPNVFAGSELVDWLMLVGLAHDRTDAVKYGRHLLQGRVIRHVENMHHFHDQPLYYTFRHEENLDTMQSFND
ncbi:Integral membrane protein [Armadillidium vulgare]|nr:Integral membrane protein [Armadillidium vulgare]